MESSAIRRVVRKSAYVGGALAIGSTAAYSCATFAAMMNYAIDAHGLDAAISISPKAVVSSLSAGLDFTRAHLNELFAATALSTTGWVAMKFDELKATSVGKFPHNNTPAMDQDSRAM